MEAYFDRARDAWILSNYDDVAAALRDAGLVPASPCRTGGRVVLDRVVLDDGAHAGFRAEGLGVLSPDRMEQWRAEFAGSADNLAAALPMGVGIDLLEQYARPWSLAVAAATADVAASEQLRLSSLARCVFRAACDPFDSSLASQAGEATVELAGAFSCAAAFRTQMYCALACSLPAFLGLSWKALLQHPAELRRLRNDPALMTDALEELLRYAGPARAQFRQAVRTVTIGQCTIRPRERVILMLDAANRDPSRFQAPDELRLDRRDGPHLALGSGSHACIGGTLVRMAAGVATRALIGRFAFAERWATVAAEHFGVRFLDSLTVQLRPAAELVVAAPVL